MSYFGCLGALSLVIKKNIIPILILAAQKNLFGLGQKLPWSELDWTLIYWGSEVCSSRVGSWAISRYCVTPQIFWKAKIYFHSELNLAEKFPWHQKSTRRSFFSLFSFSKKYEFLANCLEIKSELWLFSFLCLWGLVPFTWNANNHCTVFPIFAKKKVSRCLEVLLPRLPWLWLLLRTKTKKVREWTKKYNKVQKRIKKKLLKKQTILKTNKLLPS